MKKTDIEKLLEAAKKDNSLARATMEETYKRQMALRNIPPIARPPEDEINLWADDPDLAQELIKQEEEWERLFIERCSEQDRLLEIYNANAYTRQATDFILFALQDIDAAYKTLTLAKLPMFVMGKVYAKADEQTKRSSVYSLSLQAVTQYIQSVFSRKDDLITLPAIRFKALTIPISKVGKDFIELCNHYINPTDEDMENISNFGGISAEVKGKTNKKVACNVYVSFDLAALPAGHNIINFDKLNHFDKCVLKAVGTLYVSNVTQLTEKMVFDVMTNGAKENPQMLAKIKRSLDKMRQIDIKIICGEQAGLYPGKGLEIEYQDRILPAAVITTKVKHPNNKISETTLYNLQAEPPILKYSKTLGHMTTVNASLLNVPNVSNSERNIVLINEIIEMVKVASRMQNGIVILNYDNFFKKIDIPDSVLLNRTQKKRLIETVNAIVTHFKNEKEIVDFEEMDKKWGVATALKLIHHKPPTKRKYSAKK